MLANFQAGNPSLLPIDEVETLFHELGHGLHNLCSTVTTTQFSSVERWKTFFSSICYFSLFDEKKKCYAFISLFLGAFSKKRFCWKNVISLSCLYFLNLAFSKNVYLLFFSISLSPFCWKKVFSLFHSPLKRDFVECPSQMLEYFVYEAEGLEVLSGHFEGDFCFVFFLWWIFWRFPKDRNRKLSNEIVAAMKSSKEIFGGYRFCYFI